jgi:hypothetical protein
MDILDMNDGWIIFIVDSIGLKEALLMITVKL